MCSIINFCPLIRLPNLAWSGFYWYCCCFPQLQWGSSTCLRPCEFRAHEGTSVIFMAMSFILFYPWFLSCRNFFQVAEILKDRPSWYRDCRCLNILSVIPTGNGGTIELIYLQVCCVSLRQMLVMSIPCYLNLFSSVLNKLVFAICFFVRLMLQLHWHPLVTFGH